MNPENKTPVAQTVKKFWSLNVKRGADGGKHLDVQVHGVIDGGWMDESGVDTKGLIAELNQHLDAKTVGVRINSMGGSAFGGVALYNALDAHPAAVTCSVEGLAASAASLVAMAGNTKMGRGAMMMIHSPSALAMGNADELRKTADVLDKVQDALASIYTKKTGKSAAEVNDLLDDETWMTADDAIASGFADGYSDDAADGDPEPDEDDPNEGNEDEREEQPAARGGELIESPGGAVMMRGEELVWNGVAFPAARFPAQVLAMAKVTAPPIAPAPTASGTTAAPEPPPAPALALVPPPAPPPPITRAELALRSPELLAALIDEGRAAGATTERARLQAIDDLGLKGCADLVAAAKYSDKPMDARDLAVAAIKAGHQVGAELLAARRVESRVLAGVTTTAPDQTASTAEARHIQAMVAAMNARRGETR